MNLEFETSQDDFLGGRLKCLQPSTGFRSAMDAVFLAASVMPKAGQSMLEIGCATGVSMLCAVYRAQKSGIQVTAYGFDAQADLIDLAQKNAALNQLSENTIFKVQDLFDESARKAVQLQVDHVFTNPPYFKKGEYTPPKNAIKNLAYEEPDCGVEGWILAAAKFVKSGGSLTLIHRAERLADILKGFDQAKIGGISILPLFPFAGEPASRVLVKGFKGSREKLKLMPGLILHETHERYTKAALDVLQEAQNLPL